MTSTILATIIITIIVYNAIGTTIYLLSKEDEGYAAMWGLGIIFLVSNIVVWVVTKIMNVYTNRKFKALLINEAGELYYCDSSKAYSYIEDCGEHEYKFARAVLDKYSIKDGWQKKHCSKFADGWILSARYVPIKVCIAENAKKLEGN